MLLLGIGEVLSGRSCIEMGAWSLGNFLSSMLCVVCTWGVSVYDIGSRQVHKATINARENLAIGTDTTDIGVEGTSELRQATELGLKTSRIVRGTILSRLPSNDESGFVQGMAIDIAYEGWCLWPKLDIYAE